MPALQSFLPASCSCADTNAALPISIPFPQRTSSDENTSTSEDSTTTTGSSSASLQSGLSLPSVPSLQRFRPDLPTTSSLSSPDTVVSYLLVSSFCPHRSPVSALAVSPTHLYSASSCHVRVWDLFSLSEVDAFNLFGDGAVKSIAFSGDGSLFTAHQDRRIRVWRPESEDHSSGVRHRRHRLVATLPTLHDRLLRSLLPKNYVRVRRHRKLLWVEHADAVSGIAARNGLLYSVSWDKMLKIWRASDLRCIESVKAHDDAVNAVAVSGDGTVYTGSADARIRVWRKEKGAKKHALVATLERHRSAVNALALGDGGDSGEVLYSGAGDRSILVWEREESAGHMVVAGALRGHRGAVLSLASAEEGAVVVSGSADRTVRVWKRQGEEGRRYDCLAVLEGYRRAVRAVAAVCDGTVGGFTVCGGSLDGEIRVWQIWMSSSSKFIKLSNSENNTDYEMLRWRSG